MDREGAVRRASEALLGLVVHPAFVEADVERALPLLTEAAARALDVQRASVWLLDDAGGTLRCLDHWDRVRGSHEALDALTTSEFPRYFEALRSGRAIDAGDARRDPRTAELSAYLTQHGIGALLDATIRVEGRVVGVVCHEHVGPPRPWTVEERAVAGSLADQVTTLLLAAQRRRSDRALREIFAATARETGDGFLRALVRHLAQALGFRDTFLALVSGDRQRARVVASWTDGRPGEPMEYALDGTPCAEVAAEGACVYPSGVADRFPRDVMLREQHVESYVAAPLADSRGEAMGLLIATHDRPLTGDTKHILDVFRVFADRAAAELDRQRTTQALHASEERYRHFVESSVASILRLELHPGLPLSLPLEEQVEWLLAHADVAECNDAFAAMVGRPRAEVEGRPTRTLSPDTDAQRGGARQLLEQLRSGHGTREIEFPLSDGTRRVLATGLSPVVEGDLLVGLWITHFDVTDRTVAVEEVARLNAALRKERDYLRTEVRSVGAFGQIIGESPTLRRVLHQIDAVAPTDATVLLLGESGVGKELFARAIHDRSARADGPLVRVNCASVPRELFESEFFGHVRGAFTGATANREGRFELADGGTLFLDEIGEVPPELQPKLLRVLQEHELERVGEATTRKVDVRVVAATNRDLEAEVKAGRFRQDLYFRLATFPIRIPPLRDRTQDILPLARTFLARAARRLALPEPVIPEAEAAQLVAYDWPGNVRELQNVIERALILAKDGVAHFDLSAARVVRKAPPAPDPGRGETPDRARLASALADNDWNILRTARALGIPRPTLYRYMRLHGLQRPRE